MINTIFISVKSFLKRSNKNIYAILTKKKKYVDIYLGDEKSFNLEI